MARKHLIMMLLCCLFPMAALTALLLFQIRLNTVVWIGIVLLCPILHFVMMKLMMEGQAHKEHAGPYQERLHSSQPSSAVDQRL
jgi:hypothetical protein